MDRLIYQNDRIVESEEAALSPTLAGVLYGLGVFSTLRVYEGEMFTFDRHWDRLTRHAGQMQIPVPIEREAARKAVSELIAANAVDYGRLRMTILKGDTGGVWKSENVRDSEFLIFTAAGSSPAGREEALTISRTRLSATSPLAGIKRTSMVENLMALEEARERGFTEAVMVNERGEVAGATAANVFWIEAGDLFTPSSGTGCVLGITRGLVIEIAARLRINVIEGAFPVQRMLDSPEVFLTSTVREIAPVTTFDMKRYPRQDRAITTRIAREFQKLAGDARITA